jgi:hypothetical protein
VELCAAGLVYFGDLQLCVELCAVGLVYFVGCGTVVCVVLCSVGLVYFG